MARPLKWDDPEAFDKAVDEYFKHFEEHLDMRPTWTGLAIWLGFESRQSLEDYKKREGFSYPIKKALLRIEYEYEKAIFSKNPAGAIFALKNFGWKDKQEVEQSGGVTIKYQNPGDYIYPAQDQSDSGIPESI
jgi:hypothetical protein